MPLIGGSHAAKKEGPWPKCVGMTAQECRRYILAYAEDVTIQVLPQDSMMTMDFQTDRVRILVDEGGIVTQIPSRG